MCGAAVKIELPRFLPLTVTTYSGVWLWGTVQGSDGTIPIFSLRGGARQSIAALKMNGSVTCAAFNQDGSELLTSGV